MHFDSRYRLSYTQRSTLNKAIQCSRRPFMSTGVYTFWVIASATIFSVLCMRVGIVLYWDNYSQTSPSLFTRTTWLKASYTSSLTSSPSRMLPLKLPPAAKNSDCHICRPWLSDVTDHMEWILNERNLTKPLTRLAQCYYHQRIPCIHACRL